MKPKTYGHPALREVSSKLEKNEDGLLLAEKMLDCMKEYNGIGLAASQIGVNKRVIVFKNVKGDYEILINPEIMFASSTTQTITEGCLSIPGIFLPITRPDCITIKSVDNNNKEIYKYYEKINAQIVQHEIDHLDGVLFTDYLKWKDFKKIKKQLNTIRRQ